MILVYIGIATLIITVYYVYMYNKVNVLDEITMNNFNYIKNLIEIRIELLNSKNKDKLISELNECNDINEVLNVYDKLDNKKTNKELEDNLEELKSIRITYNNNALKYDCYIKFFPNNILFNILKYKKWPYFVKI